ncbi:GIY-YIG nuclease family protein [Hyphococcus luteus]|uniref:Excinuclease ABC subunit C n=1 Tax=Hyphococcus luteus TaxID=2058213 RepID=A0A2S7KB22_9PROT|nr:GIY-YIG nuclease family protein [Marinicaulis flavus]PQA89639.1 excinuclease ABC subunit C [Marinicaulis flavus]
MSGYVYFIGEKRDGPLYTGVTADIHERVFQHKEGRGSSFCRRYGLKKLVYYEPFNRIEDAIAHEKRVKKWRRAWKNRLVDAMNPDWRDLYESL